MDRHVFDELCSRLESGPGITLSDRAKTLTLDLIDSLEAEPLDQWVQHPEARPAISNPQFIQGEIEAYCTHFGKQHLSTQDVLVYLRWRECLRDWLQPFSKRRK